MKGWRIVRDDVTHRDVVAPVGLHLRTAFENPPPGSVFALDPSGLRDPAVALWTLGKGDVLLGMGAMKVLCGPEAGDGELKSMRTAPSHLRRGVAAALSGIPPFNGTTMSGPDFPRRLHAR